MAFSRSIPRDKPNGLLPLTIDVGEMLFILGANGTGKSSLMQTFASATQSKTRRITAHRQTWFRSGSPELTGKQRADYESLLVHLDARTNARWMDEQPEQRAQMAFFDLVSAEHADAHRIANAARQGNEADMAKLVARDSAIMVMNRLLQLANLQITVSIEANNEILAVRNSSKPYSIAKLSDGERNAILIAANVLTVPPDTLFLIDEPERHLHRSIISPLLSLLLKARRDCAFIVSTHEPLLPVDNPESKVLLTRGCVYDGDNVTSYDVDLLERTDAIDDDLKRTILGERRKIVFVEGVEHSLDKPLYALLFPNASIVAKANCREVENAVVGIKNSAELHWVKPFGFVDNDACEPERMAELQRKGVSVLNVFSVESVYYHPEVQRMAGERLAVAVGGDLDKKLKQALTDALRAIQQKAEHLSTKIAEKAARAKVFNLLPTKEEMKVGRRRTLVLDCESFLNEEAARLKALIQASDFVGILKRYPIRESNALNAIAKALGFTDRAQYETAVRIRLADDPAAVNVVRALIGALPDELVA